MPKARKDKNSDFGMLGRPLSRFPSQGGMRMVKLYSAIVTDKWLNWMDLYDAIEFYTSILVIV